MAVRGGRRTTFRRAMVAPKSPPRGAFGDPMPKNKPQATSADRSDAALIASGVRTLDAEASGVSALANAMQNGLGPAFVAAVETIRKAKGRVIVSGMGKSATSPPRSRRRSPRPAHLPFSFIRPKRTTAISA